MGGFPTVVGRYVVAISWPPRFADLEEVIGIDAIYVELLGHCMESLEKPANSIYKGEQRIDNDYLKKNIHFARSTESV